jgi:hypothetical protein
VDDLPWLGQTRHARELDPLDVSDDGDLRHGANYARRGDPHTILMLPHGICTGLHGTGPRVRAVPFASILDSLGDVTPVIAGTLAFATLFLRSALWIA